MKDLLTRSFIKHNGVIIIFRKQAIPVIRKTSSVIRKTVISLGDTLT